MPIVRARLSTLEKAQLDKHQPPTQSLDKGELGQWSGWNRPGLVSGEDVDR